VDYTSDADETTQEAFDDLNKSIESAMSAMDLSQLPGMDFGFAGGNADGLTLKKALKEWLIGGTRQGDTIDLDIGGKLGENIDRFQQDAMEGLCN